MFTHHPVRDGSVVSISIHGPYGGKFARRIAEEAVGHNERLGAALSVVDLGERQEFFFEIEQVTPRPAKAVRTQRAKRPTLQLWSARSLTPRSI